MDTNVPEPPGSASAPADGLLLLLAAAEELDRREALASANNNRANDQSSSQQSVSQLTVHESGGSTITTSDNETLSLQLSQASQIFQKSLKPQKRSAGDAVDSARPNKHQKTEGSTNEETSIPQQATLEEFQALAIAKRQLQPAASQEYRHQHDNHSITSQNAYYPTGISSHLSPNPSDSTHMAQSPERHSQKSQKRALDAPESTRHVKKPRIKFVAKTVTFELPDEQEHDESIYKAADTSTPQPSPTRIDWPNKGSPIPTSSKEQPTDIMATAATTVTEEAPYGNPFEATIAEAVKEPPNGFESHLTDNELTGLGIEPNEDELVAALKEDSDPELEDLLRRSPSPPPFDKRDFFGLLGQHIELNFVLATHLNVQDFISLYSISKDFHSAINGHLTHAMKACAAVCAPESGKIFDWRLYQSLCVRDPVGRTITNADGEEEVRHAPSLRWLQMVYYRERIVRDILAMMARQGMRMPKGMSLTVKKIWLLMDISTSLRRVQFMHNEEYWTDQDLYNAQTFFVKLDMYFNDPIHGPGDDGTRKLMLGQRSLSTLLRLMKREIMTTRIEVLQYAIRYCYNTSMINRNYSIFGVPPYEIGRGHREGWGAGRIHLYRPDELVMREAVRRNLDFEGQVMLMMLWGYVDPVTKKNVPVTEEEIYMSDEEEDKIAQELPEMIMRRNQEIEEMAASEEDWVEWYKVGKSGDEGEDSDDFDEQEFNAAMYGEEDEVEGVDPEGIEDEFDGSEANDDQMELD